ncbi:MAG: secretin N-terminal domain-containing protein [Magnetococcales bacterium]|nr:secretin N-terminal domain-containing protein [Magnetococcales bacterium]
MKKNNALQESQSVDMVNTRSATPNRKAPMTTPLICGLAALWLAGCQSLLPSPELQKEVEEAKGLLQQQQQQKQTPPPETAAAPHTLPPVGKEAEAEAEPLFDIQVTDVPVRSVLEGVVSGTPYSLVMDPKVDGTTSLNLKQVTVSETVEVVCRMQRFDCQKIRRGFMVFPNQVTTRLFQVHYPDMNRNGSSSLRVASGQSQTSSTTSTSTSQSQSQQQNTIGTQLDTTFHSDFWQELTDVLCATLGLHQTGAGTSTSSPGQNPGSASTSGQGSGSTGSTSGLTSSQASTLSSAGGSSATRLACSGTSNDGMERSIGISRQTGLIAARALPSELHRLEKILERMQNILERQVVLEAKVVEVQLNSGSQSGINWASLIRTGANKGITFGQTGGGTLLTPPGSPSNLSSVRGVLPIGQLPQSSAIPTPLQVPYSAFGGIMGVGIQLHDFQGFLELLESQGKVHVLSSPRISTLNSQKAVIKVGTDDFYVTNVVQVAATTTSAASTNFSIAQFFSGVALDVVPRIGEDGTITMHIHPAIARVTGKPTPLGNESFNLASNATRESDSIVRARSGEIVVIGGLITEEFQQDNDQVPFLGSLPWIGTFFGQKRDQKSKTELVILIKPTIIESPAPSTTTTSREWN